MLMMGKVNITNINSVLNLTLYFKLIDITKLNIEEISSVLNKLRVGAIRIIIL